MDLSTQASIELCGEVTLVRGDTYQALIVAGTLTNDTSERFASPSSELTRSDTSMICAHTLD